jgi:hypothetical protein
VAAFVLLLVVACVAMLGLVVDGGRAMTARQAAAEEAEQAARAGAGALSVSGLRSGTLQLDDGQAVEAAEAFTVASGHPGTATVSDGVVTVTVSYSIPTVVLGMVGIDTLHVEAAASAFDVAGVA